MAFVTREIKHNMDTVTSTSTWWWVLTGLLIAAELLTGTLYLLMLALGAAAGALAALLNLPVAVQLTAAALVGGGSAFGAYRWRRQNPPSPPAAYNPDVNLDIGNQVMVQQWAADGTSQVHYRGTPWQARPAPGITGVSGMHRIVGVEGNWLILVPLSMSGLAADTSAAPSSESAPR